VTLLADPAKSHVDASLGASGAASALAAAVRIATANLRRLHLSNVSPAALGLGASKAAGAGAGGKREKDTRESVTLSAGLTGLHKTITSRAAWGGGAGAGRLVADGPPGGGAAAAASGGSAVWSLPAVQEAVWQFGDATRPLMLAGGKDDRLGLIKHVVKGGGVLELQLAWPSEALDADGAFVAVETLLLQAQLAAKANEWRYRLYGRWPAKVYLVVEVPDEPGVVGFLEDEWAAMVASVDLTDWLAADGGFVVKPERAANWDRAARLGAEASSVGALRVYPGYVATFDDVCAALDKFLPVVTA